jgi:hypothetical protein
VPILASEPQNNDTQSRWARVDWQKQDVEIARELSVSREAVRLARKRLHQPQSNFFACKSPEAARWLIENRERIAGLRDVEIVELCPFLKCAESVSRLCKRFGIHLASWTPPYKSITRDNLRSHVRIGSRGCWLFSHVDVNGRARIGHRAVSHIVYELFNGEIPIGKFVLHTCDNGACVNPDHLYAGTAKDNARDRAANGNWTTKPHFSPVQVIEIRRLFASGETIADICRRFSKPYKAIFMVVRRRSYRHIAEER